MLLWRCCVSLDFQIKVDCFVNIHVDQWCTGVSFVMCVVVLERSVNSKLTEIWVLWILYIFHFSIYHPARMATNLEYWGISVNIENCGNSVQPQGKIVANKVVLDSSFKQFCKSAVDWLIIWSLGHCYICFFCGRLRKNTYMALEKHGKLSDFFSYSVTTLPAMCVHNWPRKVLESHWILLESQKRGYTHTAV